MYAIVKTGGKQYRVQEGQWLLVERLPQAEGEQVQLTPLLYVNDDTIVDGADIDTVSVEATILAHERGPKLRIVKFKPKRGYKRRTGHRQNLTRIKVTGISVSGSRRGASKKAAKPAAAPVAATPAQTQTEGSDGA